MSQRTLHLLVWIGEALVVVGYIALLRKAPEEWLGLTCLFFAIGTLLWAMRYTYVRMLQVDEELKAKKENAKSGQ